MDSEQNLNSKKHGSERRMLDQNTDRMYWVIGAVLVVGAMIALAVKEYPGLLTAVFDGFRAKLKF
uniref:hypothetical protein n=1 Tax=Bacillus amyloliquefaciens TaxID=1390 RepID=UPI001E4B5934|nr:hypothetical protein [Bacillus amyloliquefaciens]